MLQKNIYIVCLLNFPLEYNSTLDVAIFAHETVEIIDYPHFLSEVTDDSERVR